MKFCDFINRRWYSALFELMDHLTSDIDVMKIVSGIYLDISKAFEMVDHDLFIDKLEYAGMRGVASDFLDVLNV